MTLSELVEDYLSEFKECCDEDSAYYKNLELGEVIEKAALAENRFGKRDSHQRRLRKSALLIAKERLLDNIGQFKKTDNFDTIHKRLKATLDGIIGLGELYYYDTACCIGSKLGLRPEAVYLHRGTRVGAAAIDSSFRKLPYLRKEDLPEELHRLTPWQLEDFLCIKKNQLKEMFSRR